MKKPESQPILCGTDFSEPSRVAADAAAALATRFGAPLRLVHASVIVASPLTQDHLQTEAQRLRAAGVDLTAEVLEGSADEVLVHAAKQRDARLIVVSSVGRRAPVRWLLGSMAERTAESATVPTLVVRDAAPFQAWAQGGRALKIFVGMDFTASSDAALRWVGALQQIGPCEVTVGYADWTPQEAARLGVHGPVGLVGNPLVVQNILERDLKAKVAAVLGEDKVRITVQGGWGRSDAQLAGMASEAQADMMVVGTHQRHGWSRLGGISVSRGLLHSAPMSVVCVPAAAAGRMAVPHIHPFQRVLVAVDLNEKHGFASPYGYGICGTGGTVRLLHVAAPLHLPHSKPGASEQNAAAGREAFDEVAEDEVRLRALAPQEGEARGITTEVAVVESRDIAQTICAEAERFNADAICIGSHTRLGLGAKVLGSVSLAVLQQSRRPVLIVRPPMA
jgi:nucleotide-binding universal stress UspA family protein